MRALGSMRALRVSEAGMSPINNKIVTQSAPAQTDILHWYGENKVLSFSMLLYFITLQIHAS